MGHVLGLDDLSNTQDIMSGVLTAGVRRLPTATDVSQILVGSGTSKVATDFVGNQIQIGSTPQTITQTRNWQHEFVVNAGFATLHNLTPGWQTTGDIASSNDTATLNEVRTSQTSLRQAFMLGANDHEIAFTVEDRQLSGQAKDPNDAFEVALLDARTGLPITAVSDLNHTDALLNIQSNGTEHIASGVHKVVNGDGTATYFIDLPQALVDSAVMLSFDLLGFGAADSHVVGAHLIMTSDAR